MRRPNLFDFATSELSQDAFIGWLLSWAAPENKKIDSELNMTATRFIQAIFRKHNKTEPAAISKIEVRKQHHNIDVQCIINDTYAVVVEDKTATKNHSGQLVRYRKVMREAGYKDENILPIYYKTEDQSDYSIIEDSGYKVFLRDDILQVLNTYTGTNTILLDYRDRLQFISNEVSSYQSLPINKWNWRSWIGFYLRLQEELTDGNWDYVPNNGGGFFGYWWHSRNSKDSTIYMQIEQDKLCFKIAPKVNDTIGRRTERTKWYKRIMEKSKEQELSVKKPKRFGNGSHMTVCIFDGEYRKAKDDGTIDIPSTIDLLRKAERLLELAYEGY